MIAFLIVYSILGIVPAPISAIVASEFGDGYKKFSLPIHYLFPHYILMFNLTLFLFTKRNKKIT